MSIRIDVIPNQYGTTAVLLRQTWCEGRRVRHRTVANLSDLDPAVVDGFRAVLKGGLVLDHPGTAFVIRRALPHGHAVAVLGTLKQLGFKPLLGSRDLALATVAARILEPASQLAAARALDLETAATSLGTLLNLGPVKGNETLNRLDWLLERQPWIERSLARRHLKGAYTLIRYEVSSSYLEGRQCPLAACGHHRDGKQQITYGLLCTADGCPVTVAHQVNQVRKRFAIDRVALVGDRGMLTTVRLRADLEPAGLDGISALKTVDIHRLLRSATLKPGALVPDAVAEITSPDFPGERLMVCLNPRLRDERRRQREDLLQATEQVLESIAAAAVRRQPGSANRDQTFKAIGRKANRRKVEKHFDITVHDAGMDWVRNRDRIEAEARLDGIDVVRTSLDAEAIGPEAAVEAYKSLAGVERAFLTMKTSRLRVRPVYVYSEHHVRAHVFLCLLACHVEWHLRRRLAPLLFQDDDREGAQAQRNSPVEPATVSPSATAKADTKLTPHRLPVHRFTTLLADLGTLTLNHASLPGRPDSRFMLASQPTQLQARAFELLGMDPDRDTDISVTT